MHKSNFHSDADIGINMSRINSNGWASIYFYEGSQDDGSLLKPVNDIRSENESVAMNSKI